MKLVKIDVDANPGFAGQLRVQSIPTVYAFVDGRPVDAFQGALPESQVKAFVEKLTGPAGPSALDDLIALGKESLEIGDADLVKLRNRLVRIAIEAPELTSTGLWTQLVQEGFGAQLETLSFRTHALRFTLPIAEDGAAEAGLLHVLGILHEQELRLDRDNAGKALAEDPSDENLRRFETLRDLLLEAESRRRDLDPVFETQPARTVH